MPHTTPTSINETYDRCRIRRHESRKDAIAVPGFLATSHAFSRARLMAEHNYIVCALKKLPRNLRRSTGCTGIPWIVARHIVPQDKDYSLEVVDKLLSMAVAMELVTVIHPEDSPTDMGYIIIEDERAKRIALSERKYRVAKWE